MVVYAHKIEEIINIRDEMKPSADSFGFKERHVLVMRFYTRIT